METEVDFSLYNSLPNICSYCQREYTEANFRTLDHFRAHFTLAKQKKRKQHFKLEELDNLVQCCNECNNKKGGFSYKRFRQEIIHNRIYTNETVIQSNILNALSIIKLTIKT